MNGRRILGGDRPQTVSWVAAQLALQFAVFDTMMADRVSAEHGSKMAVFRGFQACAGNLLPHPLPHIAARHPNDSRIERKLWSSALPRRLEKIPNQMPACPPLDLPHLRHPKLHESWLTRDC